MSAPPIWKGILLPQPDKWRTPMPPHLTNNLPDNLFLPYGRNSMCIDPQGFSEFSVPHEKIYLVYIQLNMVK